MTEAEEHRDHMAIRKTMKKHVRENRGMGAKMKEHRRSREHVRVMGEMRRGGHR